MALGCSQLVLGCFPLPLAIVLCCCPFAFACYPCHKSLLNIIKNRQGKTWGFTIIDNSQGSARKCQRATSKGQHLLRRKIGRPPRGTGNNQRSTFKSQKLEQVSSCRQDLKQNWAAMQNTNWRLALRWLQNAHYLYVGTKNKWYIVNLVSTP